MGQINVACLGSSQAARNCHSDLSNLIADPETDLELIDDDGDAAQKRAEFQGLENGDVVENDSICVVVNADGSVQGAVPPDKGSLEAFVLWTEAVANRDGGGE